MEKHAAPDLGPILSLWTWFESNRKKVTIFAVVAAAVALIVAFVVWQQNRKVVAGGEALTETLVTSAFARVGQSVSAEKLLQLATEHAGTPASGRAVYQAAVTLFVDGKYTEAQTQFQRFIAENPDNTFVPQATYGIATCLEAQNKTDDAAKSYKSLADRFKTSGLGMAAACALGRILESQGKLTEALPLFEEVARADAGGMLGGEARIRVAEIQQKLPPPAPAPAPTTAPAVNPAPAVLSTNTP